MSLTHRAVNGRGVGSGPLSALRIGSIGCPDGCNGPAESRHSCFDSGSAGAVYETA